MMTNTNLLKVRIDSSGLKLKYIAECLGISYFSLRKKMDNVTEFTATEIDKFCELLGLSVEDRMRIFLQRK